MGEQGESPAEEWFSRGDRDFEPARVLLDQEGYPEIIVYHVHQAVEKYLKGFLIHFGKRPPRIHDFDALRNLASELRPDLYDDHIDLCERATRFYLEDRYPPGPPSECSLQEIAADFQQAARLLSDVRERMGG